MTVFINGKPIEVPTGSSVREALDYARTPTNHNVVLFDGSYILPELLRKTFLQAGDSIASWMEAPDDSWTPVPNPHALGFE